MKKWLGLLLILTLLIGCGRQHWWGGRPELTGIEKVDLLILHNYARSEPLEMNIQCDIAAQKHADWMAENERMSHEEFLSYSNRTVADRLKKKWTIIGENIAAGQQTPTEVVDDWLNSSGHRKNIKNAGFKYVGFGISTSKRGERYWCSVFSD